MAQINGFDIIELAYVHKQKEVDVKGHFFRASYLVNIMGEEVVVEFMPTRVELLTLLPMIDLNTPVTVYVQWPDGRNVCEGTLTVGRL